MIVLHYTAMESALAALARLCDPEAEVSCHYLIGRDGCLWQLVREGKRAWHAGAGSWEGRSDINSRSIGIELDNDGNSPFAEPLMATLEALLVDILHRRGISSHLVVGHSDTSFPRKSDPGSRFDWRRLALRGLAVWPSESPGAASDLRRWRDYAERFGYGIGRASSDVGNPETAAFSAFRRRFRPWAGDAALDAEDLRIAEHLAKRNYLDPTDPTA
ncbi:N-acetylmuramoyl-L-alanine amidase [Tropicimonas marinistellae]|uniref:N-acetylmuramoyl-L-alanine amidase n=1 Tax=Tropicimonas marinistellae TaxID=1739787 RepID=UPI000AAD4A3A|nr:N-acetylmuramoyl-L-alanine amidase [Tropicimonas marinistellae]